MDVKTTRRADILNKAGELLAVNPAATLAEVAAYAGVGKATLHRYFVSRDDLILALGYRALDHVSQALEQSDLERGSAVEALTRLMELLIPMGDKLHFLLSEPVLDTHPDFITADRALEAPLLRLIERGQTAGEMRADLPAAWILHLINFMLFAAWQAVHDGSVARRNAPHLLMTTLLHGTARDIARDKEVTR